MKNIWYSKPAAVIAFAQALIVAVAAFGLSLSGEQVAAVVGVLTTATFVWGDGVVVSRAGLNAVAEANR